MLSIGVTYGIGLHFHEMEPDKMPVSIMLGYTAGFCAIMAAAWSKTSFAVSLLRITTGRVRWFVWFIIVSVNVVLGVSGTMLLVTCWPTEKLWHPEVEGRCWSSKIGENYQMFASAYSGLMDIVLALLPWRIVWTAAIFKTEKIGALVAMSLGVVSGIITFCKILVLPEITDTDSNTVNLKIYGTAEPAVAMIAASIPVLRALIRRNRKSAIQHVSLLNGDTFSSSGAGSNKLRKSVGTNASSEVEAKWVDPGSPRCPSGTYKPAGMGNVCTVETRVVSGSKVFHSSPLEDSFRSSREDWVSSPRGVLHSPRESV